MANRDMFSHLGDLHASEKRKRDESDDGRQDWARRPWTKGIEAGPGHGPHVGVSGKERPVAVQTSNKAGKSKKVQSFARASPCILSLLTANTTHSPQPGRWSADKPQGK